MKLLNTWTIMLIPVLGVVIGIQDLVVNNKDSFSIISLEVNNVEGMIWHMIGWVIFWASIHIWYILKRNLEKEEALQSYPSESVE